MYAFILHFTLGWGTLVYKVQNEPWWTGDLFSAEEVETRWDWWQCWDTRIWPRRRPLKKDIWGKTLTEVSVFRKSASTRSEEGLSKYLEPPLLSLPEESFHWGRSHQTVFPLMAISAKLYLCIAGTSWESVLHCRGYSDSTAEQSNSWICRSAYLSKNNLDIALGGQ